MKKLLITVILFFTLSCDTNEEENTPFQPVEITLISINKNTLSGTGNENITQSNLNYF